MLEKDYPQLLHEVVNINLFRERKIRDTYFRTKISVFHNPYLMLVQMVVNIYGLKRQKVCPAIVGVYILSPIRVRNSRHAKTLK